MHRTTTALLLVTSLAACAANQGAPALDVQPVALRSGEPIESAARDPYLSGKRHLAKQEFGLALEAFRAGLAREGRSVRLLNALAVTYDELGRFDLAGRYYGEALQAEPDSAPTLNNLGRSLLRQGKAHEALPLLQRAQAQAPDLAVIGENLALARRGLANSSPSSAMAHNPELAARAGQGMRIEPVALHERLLRTRPAAEAVAPAEPLRLSARPAPGLDGARVQVANGAGRRHMARRMADHLRSRGLVIAGIRNAARFDHATSRILFRPGYENAAQRLQAYLPVAVPLEAFALAGQDVQLRLGADLLDFDTSLQTPQGS